MIIWIYYCDTLEKSSFKIKKKKKTEDNMETKNNFSILCSFTFWKNITLLFDWSQLATIRIPLQDKWFSISGYWNWSYAIAPLERNLILDPKE